MPRSQDQVVEGNERQVPSKFNLEGQNATNPDSAVQTGALPTAQTSGTGSSDGSTSASTAHDREDGNGEPSEKAGAGKPKMEKYAYHCTSPITHAISHPQSPKACLTKAEADVRTKNDEDEGIEWRT